MSTYVILHRIMSEMRLTFDRECSQDFLLDWLDARFASILESHPRVATDLVDSLFVQRSRNGIARPCIVKSPKVGDPLRSVRQVGLVGIDSVPADQMTVRRFLHRGRQGLRAFLKESSTPRDVRHRGRSCRRGFARPSLVAERLTETPTGRGREMTESGARFFVLIVLMRSSGIRTFARRCRTGEPFTKAQARSGCALFPSSRR